MAEAFRLYDYRLFCAMCPAVCDVKGINQEDAVREAKRRKGWQANGDSGLICPDDYWNLIHDPARVVPTKEDPHADDSPDAPRHPGASDHHQH